MTRGFMPDGFMSGTGTQGTRGMDCGVGRNACGSDAVAVPLLCTGTT